MELYKEESIDTVFEARWQNVLKMFESFFGEKPEISNILFIIGLQESGLTKKKFTKDQKIDIMHIAVCSLLQQYGYYQFAGRDSEGWPHFEATDKLPYLNALQQSKLIREAIVDYFEKL